MKIEKEKKKRVFQVFFKNAGGQPKYQIVFAVSKDRAVKGIAKVITKIKELYI